MASDVKISTDDKTKINPFLQLGNQEGLEETSKKTTKIFEVFLATAIGSVIILSGTLGLNYIGIVSSIITSKVVTLSTLVSTVSGVVGAIFYLSNNNNDDLPLGLFTREHDVCDFENDIKKSSEFYKEKKVLAPLKKESQFPIGLKNIGNNCFINSMWQILMADENFITRVMNIDVDEKIPINEKEEKFKYSKIDKDYIKILKHLIFEYREAQNQNKTLGEEFSQRIRRLLVNLSETNKMSLTGQEDAVEAINLINQLVDFSDGSTKEKCFIIVSKDSPIKPKEIEHLQIKQKDTIKLNDAEGKEVECEVYCKLMQESEAGGYLSLAITDAEFDKILNDYFNEKCDRTEELSLYSEGSEGIEEENYKIIERMTFFTKPPESLNVHFKRFQRKPLLNKEKQILLDKNNKPKFVYVKNKDTIHNIPDILKLPKENDEKEEYEMIAKVFHHGSIRFGHYVSCVRYGEKFFLCNDSFVEEIDPKKFEKDTYLVRYRRKAKA